jgi:hypothetical protein
MRTGMDWICSGLCGWEVGVHHIDDSETFRLENVESEAVWGQLQTAAQCGGDVSLRISGDAPHHPLCFHFVDSGNLLIRTWHLTKTTLRGYVQNIPDWCRHLYSSCDSAKHRWIVGLPCLVSQCPKLHVAWWTWAVFTRVYLIFLWLSQRKSGTFWIHPRTRFTLQRAGQLWSTQFMWSDWFTGYFEVTHTLTNIMCFLRCRLSYLLRWMVCRTWRASTKLEYNHAIWNATEILMTKKKMLNYNAKVYVRKIRERK